MKQLAHGKPCADCFLFAARPDMIGFTPYPELCRTFGACLVLFRPLELMPYARIFFRHT